MFQYSKQYFELQVAFLPFRKDTHITQQWYFQYLCVNGCGLLMRWNIYKPIALWGFIIFISYCMIILKVHIKEGSLYRNKMNLTIIGFSDPSSGNFQFWCLLMSSNNCDQWRESLSILKLTSITFKYDYIARDLPYA